MKTFITAAVVAIAFAGAAQATEHAAPAVKTTETKTEVKTEATAPVVAPVTTETKTETKTETTPVAPAAK